MKIPIVFALAVLPALTAAGSLLPAMLGGQVQQFTESGNVTGCGVTFYGTEKTQAGPALVFNGSAVLFKTGLGLVKGRISEVDSKILYSNKFNLRDLNPLPTTSIWLKAPSSPATVPAGPVKDAEDKGYIIYGAKFDSVFPVIRSVLTGESIQMGFKVATKKSEQVLFGVVEISEEEQEQLRLCIGELAK